MTQLGFSNARKLMELKNALSLDALDKVRRLPLEGDNYEKAKTLLDVAYNRPIQFTELVVLDLLNAPRMACDASSMKDALNVIEQAEQALEGLRLSKAEAGELVFAVLCESKLNNPTLVEWNKEKEKMKNDEKPTGHDASLEDMKSIIRQAQKCTIAGRKKNPRRKKTKPTRRRRRLEHSMAPSQLNSKGKVTPNQTSV